MCIKIFFKTLFFSSISFLAMKRKIHYKVVGAYANAALEAENARSLGERAREREQFFLFF